MTEKYYIIGKDQATGALKITVTRNKTEAYSRRKRWRAEYHDVVILTAQELCMIGKPGWCEVGETIEITDTDNSRDNTLIGTL